MQEIALLGLWRSKFFEKAAFYGGTALRVLYGLDRFSEDLDFSLLEKNEAFDLADYGDALKRELASFGFTVDIESKLKQPGAAIQSAFLKADTRNPGSDQRRLDRRPLPGDGLNLGNPSPVRPYSG
jgi:hypothetical protein